LLHTGAIGGDIDEGAVRVEFAQDPTAIAQDLERRGASVSQSGRSLVVRYPAGDVYRLVRDTTASNNGTLRRLAGASSSLEELFITHGEPL